MKQLIFNCDQVREDWLEADVVGAQVYLGTYCAKNDGPSDVAITPTQARELAAWLEQAALEAEHYDA